jgi:acetylornithine/N-succinyldiaminopimelate aminotransferase
MVNTSENLSVGVNVVLASFLGSQVALENTRANENFWILIGISGQIIADSNPSKLKHKAKTAKRVLVKFFVNLDERGLVNHNQIKDSLWILKSDLRICSAIPPKQLSISQFNNRNSS